MNIFASDKLPTNPAHLTRLVAVESLGGFCIKGQEIPAGETVRVEFYVARDLVAQGKAMLNP